jgi:serine/threonine protein kinase
MATSKSPPAVSAPQPRPVIGRFLVRARIGSGSQGVLYRAEDPKLGRQVAIKTLRKSNGQEQQFLQEAHSVGKLQHPNIIPVYEIGEHKGKLYLVYEFVDGQSLRDRLETGPKPEVREAATWACQILDGIECAYQAGIVHRDLTPANTMIDTAGAARVMDFGLAQASGTPLDPDAGLNGTAMYMAPEQIRGADIGPSADIFSAGLVLYERLAGHHPINAKDAMSAMYRLVHEPIPALSAYGPELAGL